MSMPLFSFSMTALAGLAILQLTGERTPLFSFLYLLLIFLLLDGFMHSAKVVFLFGAPKVGCVLTPQARVKTAVRRAPRTRIEE
jgi:hypothetical protein